MGGQTQDRQGSVSHERFAASTNGAGTIDLPIQDQHTKLNEKLRGHYAYYGVTGNSAAMARFLHEVGPRWRRWLNRHNNIRSMTVLVILRRYPFAPIAQSARLSAAKQIHHERNRMR
jgi:hypothetical protein